MKNFVKWMLRQLASRIVRKYGSEVVAVTGSIGKTSTKEAIAAVLKSKHKVRQSRKNYNNEFGVPLTIIGSKSAGKSLSGWLAIIFKALSLLAFRSDDYPEVLVLEMGIDRPGDMDYLNKIVSPRIGVLTYIGTSHIEFFGSVEKIKKEKAKIFNNLQSQGWAIINNDNEKCREVAVKVKNRLLTYGFEEGSGVRAQNLHFHYNEAKACDDMGGASFKVKYQGSYIPFNLPSAVSISTVYGALAAIAVGLAYGMNGIEISEVLRDFKAPKGRMNIIEGMRGSVILDDTYNSSPQSARSALATLADIDLPETKNKWIILGDMLELGDQSEQSHKEIGAQAAKINKAKLILLGEEALYIGMGAREAGMSDQSIFTFNNHQEIIDFVGEHLEKDDVVLVKASQGMRLEKTVKGLMADPGAAKDLLVRQSKAWQES